MIILPELRKYDIYFNTLENFGKIFSKKANIIQFYFFGFNECFCNFIIIIREDNLNNKKTIIYF